MRRAAAFLRLARPGNLGLAALGVATGALGAYGTGVERTGLAFGMVAGILGVAAGNALNDALDVDIDRRAHPWRPLPQGHLSRPQALRFSLGCIALALAAAAMTNALALLLALQLAANLLVYEYAVKRKGLVGNFLISYNVGSLFLLGALAAARPAASYEIAPLLGLVHDARLAAPLTMGLLALLLNFAREIYKGVEDAHADAPHRQTVAIIWGERPARFLASLLVLLVIPLSLLPYGLGLFSRLYAELLFPVLFLALAIPFVPNVARAQRLVKVAMLLAFAPLLAVGLI